MCSDFFLTEGKPAVTILSITRRNGNTSKFLHDVKTKISLDGNRAIMINLMHVTLTLTLRCKIKELDG